MNILLVAINAKYIHSNLAVYSLKAYAREYREHIRLLEYTINHRSEYILREIYKQRPDVLCFSCYIWNFRYVQELVTEFHKLAPEVPIWTGGPEVSYEAKAFLSDYPMVQGVMVGEGEATFRELCRFYVERNNKDGIGKMNHHMPESNSEDGEGKHINLEEIAGLVFRDEKGEIAQTAARALDRKSVV